jgi:hypothetical protein
VLSRKCLDPGRIINPHSPDCAIRHDYDELASGREYTSELRNSAVHVAKEPKQLEPLPVREKLNLPHSRSDGRHRLR